jgi:hypothetical protein
LKDTDFLLLAEFKPIGDDFDTLKKDDIVEDSYINDNLKSRNNKKGRYFPVSSVSSSGIPSVVADYVINKELYAWNYDWVGGRFKQDVRHSLVVSMLIRHNKSFKVSQQFYSPKFQVGSTRRAYIQRYLANSMATDTTESSEDELSSRCSSEEDDSAPFRTQNKRKFDANSNNAMDCKRHILDINPIQKSEIITIGTGMNCSEISLPDILIESTSSAVSMIFEMARTDQAIHDDFQDDYDSLEFLFSPIICRTPFSPELTLDACRTLLLGLTPSSAFKQQI